MTADDFPLLDLFTSLRRGGFSLGIDEYRLALSAVQLGYGTQDDAALARLCKTLWLKSRDEEEHFQSIVKAVLGRSPQAGPANPPPPIPPDRPTPSDQNKTGIPQPFRQPDRDKSESEGTKFWLEEAESGPRTTPHAMPRKAASCGDYFPVSRQRMRQGWRRLPRFLRQGPPMELDTEATIGQLAWERFLHDFVLVPRRVRAGMILLIDQEGSMVPFHLLAQQLTEAALQAGRLEKAAVYYFHNCPSRYLYSDPALVDAEPLAEVLLALPNRRTSALIFSDGGAARGGFSQGRVAQTRTFLGNLAKQVRHVAWLNPMPSARWLGTSADEIARFVAMYEVSRSGLDRVINVLRGRGDAFAKE